MVDRLGKFHVISVVLQTCVVAWFIIIVRVHSSLKVFSIYVSTTLLRIEEPVVNLTGAFRISISPSVTRRVAKSTSKPIDELTI